MSVRSHTATRSNISSRVLPIYTDVLASIALRTACCDYGDAYAITISNSPK